MMPSIDLYAEPFKRNPHPFYATMREEAPVYHYQHPDGFPSWLILRYQEGEAVLRDHRPAFAKTCGTHYHACRGTS